MTHSPGPERRAHERLPHGDLDIQLHRAGLAGLVGRPPAATCIDYSCAGLGVHCTSGLRVGERLVVDLTLYDVRAEELRGQVCRSYGDDRYGLCFTSSDSRYMRSAETGLRLRQIEAYLRSRADCA